MKPVKTISDPESFKIAADDTRRKIIHLLRAKEMTVSQIADELDLTPQTVYHHIRKLCVTNPRVRLCLRLSPKRLFDRAAVFVFGPGQPNPGHAGAGTCGKPVCFVCAHAGNRELVLAIGS